MKQILLAISSVLLFFLSVEGISRLYEGLADADSNAVPEPGTRTQVVKPIPDDYPEKQPDELRIFLFGGSAAAGAHAPSAGFFEQLRYALGQAFPERTLTMTSYAQGGAPSFVALWEFVNAIDHEPDAILVMSGNNEFLREASQSEFAFAHRIQNSLSHFAFIRVIRDIVTRRQLERRMQLLANGEGGDWRDQSSAKFLGKVEAYAENIDTIVGLARSRNIPLILCTLPANILDWPPTEPNSTPGAGPKGSGSSGPIDEIRILVTSGEHDTALAKIDEALADAPDDPRLYFWRGRVRYELGEYEAARADLVRAKDTDRVPWRVLSRFNELVREKAKLPGVYVADLERVLEENSPHGLTGSEMMSDNCHPTPEGYFLITGEIQRQLERANVIDRLPDYQSDDDLRAYLKYRNFDRATFGPPRAIYLKSNGRYTMKAPFYNYEASRGHFEAAVKVAPEDWEVWANLATLSFLDGDVETGKRELRKAVALRPDPIDLNAPYRWKVPYLEASLRRVEVELADFYAAPTTR